MFYYIYSNTYAILHFLGLYYNNLEASYPPNKPVASKPHLALPPHPIICLHVHTHICPSTHPSIHNVTHPSEHPSDNLSPSNYQYATTTHLSTCLSSSMTDHLPISSHSLAVMNGEQSVRPRNSIGPSLSTTYFYVHLAV